MFDRLIDRLTLIAPGRYVVKGGYALDVRLGDHARVTKDLDLAVTESRETVIRDMALLHGLDASDDHFTFQVELSTALDHLDGGMAIRFRVRASLAEERFEVFDLDVGFAQPSFLPTDLAIGGDLLTHANIPPVEMRLISAEQHLAEKLHAYTRVYAGERASSRVKDLVDIVLLSDHVKTRSSDLSTAIELTFWARAVEALPEHLPPPPSIWETTYRTLALEVGIEPRLEAGWGAASAFLNPVLGGEVAPDAVWSPDGRRWVAH